MATRRPRVFQKTAVRPIPFRFGSPIFSPPPAPTAPALAACQRGLPSAGASGLPTRAARSGTAHPAHALGVSRSGARSAEIFFVRPMRISARSFEPGRRICRDIFCLADAHLSCEFRASTADLQRYFLLGRCASQLGASSFHCGSAEIFFVRPRRISAQSFELPRRICRDICPGKRLG